MTIWPCQRLCRGRSGNDTPPHRPRSSRSRQTGVGGWQPARNLPLPRTGFDGAGNRISASGLQRRQVRDLPRTRRCDCDFPSDACDAPLTRFASAAGAWPPPRNPFNPPDRAPDPSCALVRGHPGIANRGSGVISVRKQNTLPATFAEANPGRRAVSPRCCEVAAGGVFCRAVDPGLRSRDARGRSFGGKFLAGPYLGTRRR